MGAIFCSATAKPYVVRKIRKAFVKPIKVVHCDQVHSVHRFSATGRQSLAMVEFLHSEKTQNGPFFAEMRSKSFFSQKGPISNWILCTFLPKHLLATVNLKGKTVRCATP